MQRSIIARLGVLFVVLMLMAFPAAAYAQEGWEPEYDDADYPVEVYVGEELVISMEANPSTGYHWELAGPLDESILVLVDVDHQRPVENRVGAPGHTQFTILAVGPGTTDVVFNYLRPWEDDVPPARVVTFTVTVHEFDPSVEIPPFEIVPEEIDEVPGLDEVTDDEAGNVPAEDDAGSDDEVTTPEEDSIVPEDESRPRRPSERDIIFH